MSFRFLTCGFLAVICAAALECTPDPNLFDGRYSSFASDSSVAGNQMGKKGEDNKNGEDNEGVESTESTESSGGSKKPSTGAAAEEVTEVTDVKFSSEKPGNESSSAKATPSSNRATRSFEEFEIGAIHDTHGQIEMKRSKELGELPSSTAQTPDKVENSNTQNSDENAQKSSSTNQEPFEGSGSVDYGKDVPFGL